MTVSVKMFKVRTSINFLSIGELKSSWDKIVLSLQNVENVILNGSRTIAPRTTAPWTIASQVISPRKITPQDNCFRIINPWTSGAETTEY